MDNQIPTQSFSQIYTSSDSKRRSLCYERNWPRDREMEGWMNVLMFRWICALMDDYFDRQMKLITTFPLKFSRRVNVIKIIHPFTVCLFFLIFSMKTGHTAAFSNPVT